MEYEKADCIDLEENEAKTCITLPGEKILTGKRAHSFIPFFSSVITLTASLFFTISGALLFYFILQSIPLLLSFLVLMVTLTIFAITKIIVDWYFHLYIVTTRKIMEIRSVPFFGERIDDVFLDQVRTTEVDAQIPTFLHELLGMGNVIIAFDRPSHDKVFILENIPRPRQTAMYLCDALEDLMRPSEEPSKIWFQHEKPSEHSKFTEDLIEGRTAHA